MRPNRDNTIELERFIRRKYADEEWVDRTAGPAYAQLKAAAAAAATAAAAAASAAKDEAKRSKAREAKDQQEAAEAGSGSDTQQPQQPEGPAVADLLALGDSRQGSLSAFESGSGFGAAAAAGDRGSSLMDLIDEHYATGRLRMPMAVAMPGAGPLSPATSGGGFVTPQVSGQGLMLSAAPPATAGAIPSQQAPAGG